MTLSQRVIAGVISLVIILIILDLVKRRKLREEYSILWLGGGLLMLLPALHDRVIFWLAGPLGIKHPAYSIFVLAMFVGLVLAIHFTIVLSKLTAQNWRLTQELALLRAQINNIQNQRQENNTSSAFGGKNL